MGAPTLAAFAFAGAVTSFKPNWPAPGYLTMLPLALRVLKNFNKKYLDAVLDVGLRRNFGDDWIRLGGLKIFADRLRNRILDLRPDWIADESTSPDR